MTLLFQVQLILWFKTLLLSINVIVYVKLCVYCLLSKGDITIKNVYVRPQDMSQFRILGNHRGSRMDAQLVLRSVHRSR